MIVLGLNHGEINSSAAIVKDGRLIAGCLEERFNRQKKSKAFPERSIKYCLDRLGIRLEDCDLIAQAWNPGSHWVKYNPLLSKTRIKREDYLYTVPDNLYNLTERKIHDWLLLSFPNENKLPPVYFVSHHRAHAANSFFLSPFKKAAILTCDWHGEFETATMSVGRSNKIDVLSSLEMPDSLGLFYATFTELLGYRPDNDEWKVMALSAFPVDCLDFYKNISKTVRLLDNGYFELDQSYYRGSIIDQPYLYTPKLIDMLGGRVGKPDEQISLWHKKVARSMQLVAEDIACHMLKKLYLLSKCKNLTLGGGFFMNSVLNGKILKKTPFEKIYIPYAPADCGNSIGAAFYVHSCIKGKKRIISHNSSYIGPSYSDAEILKCLRRRKVKHEFFKDKDKKIASLLCEKKVVAVLSGRSEFGERSLGNRCILADPRLPEMKDEINSMIKYRENYRPFAPAVIYEEAPKYFEVAKGFDSFYMEKVVPIKKRCRKLIPAVTHIDGSGRLQTVKKEYNKDFYNIIKEFGKLTGIPIVLNTSFNINNEPMVLSPDDALNTFFNSGLEHLFLGPYYIHK